MMCWARSTTSPQLRLVRSITTLAWTYGLRPSHSTGRAAGSLVESRTGGVDRHRLRRLPAANNVDAVGDIVYVVNLYRFRSTLTYTPGSDPTIRREWVNQRDLGTQILLPEANGNLRVATIDDVDRTIAIRREGLYLAHPLYHRATQPTVVWETVDAELGIPSTLGGHFENYSGIATTVPDHFYTTFGVLGIFVYVTSERHFYGTVLSDPNNPNSYAVWRQRADPEAGWDTSPLRNWRRQQRQMPMKTIRSTSGRGLALVFSGSPHTRQARWQPPATSGGSLVAVMEAKILEWLVISSPPSHSTTQWITPFQDLVAVEQRFLESPSALTPLPLHGLLPMGLTTYRRILLPTSTRA